MCGGWRVACSHSFLLCELRIGGKCFYPLTHLLAPKIHSVITWMCLFSYRALTFVYPFGATLSVMKPAVAVLSTGSVCFPLNRPILAFYHSKVLTFLDMWVGGYYFIFEVKKLHCDGHMPLIPEPGRQRQLRAL